MKSGSIGVGMTCRNRNQDTEKSISEWKKYLPENCKFVIVDDASEVPINGASFRFETNQGIAIAKNKCIELLEDCEHIFLTDSDCFPKRNDWFEPYINSGSKHLCLTFDRLKNGRQNGRKFLKEENGLNVYQSPCGVMLYVHNDCIQKVGGFDEFFLVWGFEHVNYSNRIFNAGLTMYRYMDIKNPLDYFTCLDYEQVTISSVMNRNQYIDINRDRFNLTANDDSFKPYKSSQNHYDTDVILCSFFNYQKDPQRDLIWDVEQMEGLNKLIKSCEDKGIKLIVFTDCLENNSLSETTYFKKVNPDTNFCPNVFRYFVYLDYLKSNRYNNVFLVDSTDVEVLRNPFPEIEKGKLYVGDEYGNTTNNAWMKRRQQPLLRKLIEYPRLINRFSREPLLNCGITGGDFDTVIKYLRFKCSIHDTYTKGQLQSTDMAVFTFVVRKFLNDILVHGEKVNTRFKKFETNNISWFKHK